MEVKRVLQLQMAVVVVVLFLLAGLNGARAAVVEKYFVKGGNMVLEPNVGTTITNILWKHKGNLLAEWVKDVVELTYYDTFVNRTKLSIITGRLGITKMTKDDAGAYTLEINSKVHGESYTAKMIKAVPKPTVVIQPLVCTRESANCTLRCTPKDTTEDTTEAEPITYTWRRDGDEWRAPGKEPMIDKELVIDKDTTSGTQTFSCRMKNPVSMKESEPEKNPFYKEEIEEDTNLVGIVVGSLFGVGAVLGILGFLGYRNRDAITAWVRRGAANDNPDANGNPAADKKTNERVPLNTEKTEDGEPTRDGAAVGDV